MMQAKLLIVEDDATLAYALGAYLEMKGFEIVLANNGAKGLAEFRKYPFDLCLLDIMMPDMDGFQLASNIREEAPGMPFIFLTAKSMKVDKLKGFDLGADDYLVKPIDEEELVARIKAVLRRSGNLAEEITSHYSVGNYSFDYSNHQLNYDGDIRQLTEREAKLLRLLCESKGQLLSRQQVLKSLWSQNDYFTRRSMDVFISRLRKYLSADPAISITNVYGTGFILSDSPEKESAPAV